MKNRHFPHIIALSTYKGGFDYEKNYLYYFNNCHKHFVRVQFNIRFSVRGLAGSLPQIFSFL